MKRLALGLLGVLTVFGLVLIGSGMSADTTDAHLDNKAYKLFKRSYVYWPHVPVYFLDYSDVLACSPVKCVFGLLSTNGWPFQHDVDDIQYRYSND